MKKNDIYFDENPESNETELKPKFNNKKKKFEYKNIFLCPLNKNDCVNSIDIFEDIILYGTIMGNVYLCRVNENNLYQDINQQIYTYTKNQIDINNIINNKNETQYEIKLKYKVEEKESSKISCIKLNSNKNLNNSINNYEQFNGNQNETLRTNNENQKEKIYFESEIIPTSKNTINNLKKHEITAEKKILNMIENHNNKSDKNIIDDYSFTKKDLIPFPQVTQLILNATENIPCVSFDTKDKINLSIGDYEIIRLENMNSFNINDDNSNYNYLRIRNYKSENEHIKNCENTTCMLTDKYFLIVHTIFAENNSNILLNKVSYQNKMITSFEVVEGEIEMYNYSIPFDFDGDRFLFVDYESDNLRRICIYYTLSKKNPYIHKISTGFGHISYMKFLLNDKVVLCKEHKICEIYKIDDNFRLLDSWEHNGEEIIAMNIYIEGTKDNEPFSEGSKTNLSFKKFYENESQTIEIIKKGNNAKRKKKYNHLERIYISPKSNNIKTKPFEKEKFTNSTLRELNSNDNKNITKKNMKLKKDIENGYLACNFKSEIENRINKFGNDEDNVIEIYSKYKSPSLKEFRSINEYKNKKLKKIKDENKFFKLSDKNIAKRDGSYNHYIQDKDKPTERSFNQNEKKIYILTVDLNGNFNLYHKNKNKTIFNLYNISNIDNKYKENEFFSMGFPYYVTMNSKYYAISTDHGIFVLSNKV